MQCEVTRLPITLCVAHDKRFTTPCPQVAREGYGTLPEAQHDAPEPLFGPKARAVVARRWNEAVDGTLGALARELARRGI